MMTAAVEIDSRLKQCRICLDDEHPDGIISPCLCSGNSAYVHRECLNKWRAIDKNRKGFKACDICHFEYVIEAVNNNPQDEIKRLRKYYFFVTRDLLLMMFLIQVVIVSIAYLLKKLDTDEQKPPIHDFFIYYLNTIILLLVIIGVITLCIAVGGSGFYFPGGNNGSKVAAIFAIIIVIIGVFVVAHSCLIFIKETIQRHKNKLWLRQEADKHIVKDFQKSRNELEKYKNHIRPQATTVNTNDPNQN